MRSHEEPADRGRIQIQRRTERAARSSMGPASRQARASSSKSTTYRSLQGGSMKAQAQLYCYGDGDGGEQLAVYSGPTVDASSDITDLAKSAGRPAGRGW